MDDVQRKALLAAQWWALASEGENDMDSYIDQGPAKVGCWGSELWFV